MSLIELKLPHQTSEVYIGSGIVWSVLSDLFRKHRVRSCLLFIGKGLEPLYPELGKEFKKRWSEIDLEVVLVPDSEQDKNLKTLTKLYSASLDHAQRKTWVIALGGGVIGDMVGFFSSTWLRGLPLVVIPTTLLAQVDASVGGKNGINFGKLKNAIGNFNQPEATIVDVSFLKTLKLRDLKAGAAEMLKHGLLADKNYWKELSQLDPNKLTSLYSDVWQDLITKSVEIKAAIVIEDEKEEGKRALLNLGHSLGHMLEAKTLYKKYLHGECVLAGLDFALYSSYKKGFLPKQAWLEAHSCLLSYGIRITDIKISKQEFIKRLALDKKMQGKTLKFIFVSELGKAFIKSDTDLLQLYTIFQSYQKLESSLVPRKLA